MQCKVQDVSSIHSLFPFLSPQIREKFDSGEEFELTDDINPHDVACLLKEFFRSLPEPLMTVDLFGPFLATRSKCPKSQNSGVGVKGVKGMIVLGLKSRSGYVGG